MKCPDVVTVEVDILCYSLAFLSLDANFNFQKRGLQDFVQHSIYSCWSCFQNHFCTISKRLIGSVPIGEGLGDVAQWRGWTPLSTSVYDSLFLCFFFASVISVVFHSEHLIFANAVLLVNLLHAFFYNKLLMHTSRGSTDLVIVLELVNCLCKFVNAYQVQVKAWWRRSIPEGFGGEAERKRTKLGSTIVNDPLDLNLSALKVYVKNALFSLLNSWTSINRN